MYLFFYTPHLLYQSHSQELNKNVNNGIWKRPFFFLAPSTFTRAIEILKNVQSTLSTNLNGNNTA